jgi:molecular chaperone HtpG
MKEKEYDKYVKFYTEFGAVLKEGLHYDWENKDALTDLLLFQSTTTAPDTYRSLEQYVKAMPSDQKEIYYLIGESKNACVSSPHLEVFKAKKYEVLFLTDPVDEWIAPNLNEYQKKPLKSVTQQDLDLGDKKEQEAKQKQASETFKDLQSYLKKQLETKVKDVRFSSRLTDSASCLVNDEQTMSEQMIKMFKMMGQAVPEQKRILELNPTHPLITALQKKIASGGDLGEYAELLYEQAIVAEGGKLENPLAFAQKISRLLTKVLE